MVGKEGERRTLGDSPEVLPALDGTAVSSRDVLSAADDREGHGGLQTNAQSAPVRRECSESKLTVKTLACSADASSSASIGGVYTRIPCALMTSRICSAWIQDHQFLVLLSIVAVPETHLLLELSEVGGSEGVGLGDNRDQVNAGAESLHNLNVEGLEAVWATQK
jgi:hypothetical protein